MNIIDFKGILLNSPCLFCPSACRPFCNFYRHTFCPDTLAAHCFFVFKCLYFNGKTKNQRAVPTLQTKRYANKNYPKL